MTSSNTRQIPHWIAGRPVTDSGSRTGEVFNPATGAVAALVPFATTKEVNTAVSAALDAFKAWAATPALRRARVLFRFKELVEASSDELAHPPDCARARQDGERCPWRARPWPRSC